MAVSVRSPDVEVVESAIRAGNRDVNDLTNMLFYARHPEMTGRRIRPNQRDLVREWLTIRDRIVIPAVAARLGSSAPGSRTVPRRSTRWLRTAWRGHECAEDRMVALRFFQTTTPVNRVTREAFTSLEHALRSVGYRPKSVWNYNCRDIQGSEKRSLHAYGLAVDIDPRCNPHRRQAPGPARFSPEATQEARCRDVVAGRADTTFTPEQVAAVEAIQTVDGLQVFAWGGRWRSSPDSMHFQINVSPRELRRGLAPR
jgi:hypothetical protein